MLRAWYRVERLTRCLPEPDHSSARPTRSPATCKATTSTSSWDLQKLGLAIDCSPVGNGGQAARSTWGTTGGKRRDHWPTGQAKFGISAQKVGSRPALLQSPSDIIVGFP